MNQEKLITGALDILKRKDLLEVILSDSSKRGTPKSCSVDYEAFRYKSNYEQIYSYIQRSGI